jgi:Lar family restriction alleviation protein
MKETELKPCPFCGGEAEFTMGEAFPSRDTGEMMLRVRVMCKECRARMETFTTVKIEIKNGKLLTKSIHATKGVKTLYSRWNRRADNEQRED